MSLSDFTSIIYTSLPEPQASLLAGMLFGVKTNMPKSFYNALIITGTLHVVALSGMNISIIIRLLFDIFGAWLGKVFGSLLTIVAIFGFVLLVGPSATIVRAAIMGSLSVLAVFMGRKDVPIISLFLAAAVMLLIDWQLIADISFQLSFLATLGIILFSKKSIINGQTTIQKKHTDQKTYNTLLTAVSKVCKKLMEEIVVALKKDLRVALAAQVLTFPVVIFHFQRVSLISPFANMLVGWLIAPITYLGFVAVLLGMIWQPLGYIASLIVWVPLTVFITIVELLSHIPLASISW